MQLSSRLHTTRWEKFTPHGDNRSQEYFKQCAIIAFYNAEPELYILCPEQADSGFQENFIQLRIIMAPSSIQSTQRTPLNQRRALGSEMSNQSFHRFSEPSDPSWAHKPTTEPLSPEMEDEVKKELREYYHYYRRDVEFRQYVKINIRLSNIDLVRTPTQTEAQMKDWSKLALFCNKATTLYWMNSEQQNNCECPGLPICAIYNAWFRYHNNFPNIEFGHFFCSQFRATVDAPSKLDGIVQVHRALCTAADSSLRDYMPAHVKINTIKNYSVLPLCKALLVVIDKRHMLADNINTPAFIDEFGKGQTLLLIRTGHEKDLSAPITFDDISADSLPLDRDDCSGIDVIRVPLSTAVNFIAALQKREDLAFPKNRMVDGDICPDYQYGNARLSIEDWVESVMRESREQGIDNVERTWEAVRKVEARRRGEIFERLELWPVQLSPASRWG